MNKLLFASTLCLLLIACDQKSGNDASNNESNKATKATMKSAQPIDKKAIVDEAKKITMAFGGALKSRLQEAMKAGGPINALSVCNTDAMPITTKAAMESNALVSRVSLKNRNPKNTPNNWQKTVLEDFDARAARGEDVNKMAFAKIVDNGEKKQLHFMKALPTGAVCLTCHGAKIEADVQAKLTELYPADLATGYQQGQVRGAIVVVKDIN